MILNLLADADALFQINAALFKLGAGDTDFDQQLLPYPGTDEQDNKFRSELDNLLLGILDGMVCCCSILYRKYFKRKNC